MLGCRRALPQSLPHCSTKHVNCVARKPPSCQVLCPRLLQAVSQVFLVVLRAHRLKGSVFILLKVRCEGKAESLAATRCQLMLLMHLHHSSSNPSPTVAVTQLSPSERRGRCPYFDLLEEASRTLSVHERWCFFADAVCFGISERHVADVLFFISPSRGSLYLCRYLRQQPTSILFPHRGPHRATRTLCHLVIHRRERPTTLNDPARQVGSVAVTKRGL